MIRIAFCDDNQAELQRIRTLLKELHPFDDNYEVTVFSSGEELLRSDKRPFDLLFLDVQMPELNGYDTARRIRETDQRTTLIFLTGVAAPTVEVFQVSPFRYLMKQMDDATLSKELTAAFEEVSRKTQIITFRTGGDIIRINVSSVLYLTISGRAVELITDHGRQEVKMKIGEMYEMLASHGFGFSHKSYLVNFNRILSITGSTVIMENGDILPISQPKAKTFKQEFIRFAGMRL
ncbi:MAG: response regulator transcription factor [Oscillospiraceae bacterium]|nr:response regulator transcription factor [Oscillospiraceae bacterium]